MPLRKKFSLADRPGEPDRSLRRRFIAPFIPAGYFCQI
jgi:hypothetical protein